jgi:hypothetical protein
MSDIIHKIKKLLELSDCQGATEAEATTALKLASALMVKYGIKEVDARGINHKVMGIKETIVYKGSISDKWVGMVAQGVAKMNGIQYYQRMNQRTMEFVVVGPEIQREAVQLMFEFVADQVQLFYKQSLPHGLTQRDRAEYRRTFKFGCAYRIFSRCNEIVAAMKKDGIDNDTTALMVVESFAKRMGKIKDWLGEQGITLKEKK